MYWYHYIGTAHTAINEWYAATKCTRLLDTRPQCACHYLYRWRRLVPNQFKIPVHFYRFWAMRHTFRSSCSSGKHFARLLPSAQMLPAGAQSHRPTVTQRSSTGQEDETCDPSSELGLFYYTEAFPGWHRREISLPFDHAAQATKWTSHRNSAGVVFLRLASPYGLHFLVELR